MTVRRIHVLKLDYVFNLNEKDEINVPMALSVFRDGFFNLQYLGQYLSCYIQTWHDGRLMHAMAHLLMLSRVDDLELDLDFETICKGLSLLVYSCRVGGGEV